MVTEITALAGWISAYAMQIVNEMGGVEAVELLAVAGFVLGFLSCLYEIMHIDR